jgi:hypothetical protein
MRSLRERRVKETKELARDVSKCRQPSGRLKKSCAGALIVCFGVLFSAVVGCAPISQQILDTRESQSQVKLRQVQSRSFDTQDKEFTMRAVIATLQDLSFVIDKADLALGTVSATKLDGYAMRMTVTTRTKGKEIVVRANAQLNTTPIVDPQPYQSFFAALERAMFLAAHSVD